MNMEDLVLNSDKLARKEIELYGIPTLTHYELSMEKGIKLAEKLNANIDVVKIGIALMDWKLGEAMKNGKAKEHILMSSKEAKKILKEYKIGGKNKQVIIDCIEGHHGHKKYTSLEAEICANADCYKFLHPKGFFALLSINGRLYNDLNKELADLEYRLEEKHNNISLPLVKTELEAYYQEFKHLIAEAKK